MQLGHYNNRKKKLRKKYSIQQICRDTFCSIKKYSREGFYLLVLNTLKSLEIIDINDSYSKNRFSKSFRLTNFALESGLITDVVQSMQFKKRLNRIAESEYKEVVKNPLFEKILYNTAQLYLLDEQLFYIERILPDSKYEEVNGYLNDISEPLNEFRIKRYDDYYKGFKALNQTSRPIDVYKSPLCFSPSISEYGRVTHLGASIPKHIRTCMRTKKNEIIWEVDMSSAQLSLLILEWLKHIKESDLNVSDNQKGEIKLCLNLLNEGGFYEYIKNQSPFCNRMEYSNLKLNILKLLNAKTTPSKLYYEVKRIFPFFMEFISKMKIPNHKIVSHIAFKAESKIFLEEFMAIPKEIFALPIHDCILTTEKYALKLKEGLINRTRAIYSNVIPRNYSLDGLFKVARVSLLDEETEVYQIKKWNEESQDDHI